MMRQEEPKRTLNFQSIQACKHMFMSTFVHTHTQTHIHTGIHTQAHTHTYTHAHHTHYKTKITL